MGHVIKSNAILVDPAKVEVVKKWEPPKSLTEIRSFLGLAGYYRRFIHNFSSIASSLTELTKKGVNYVWGVDQEKVFHELNESFTLTRRIMGWGCVLYGLKKSNSFVF